MHKWTHDEPWGAVPSVTQINGTLDKSGALVGWAVNTTCEAAHRMVTNPTDPAFVKPLVAALREQADAEAERRTPKPWLVKYLRRRADDIETNGYTMPKKWRGFQQDMRAAELDHNAVRDDAALRGTEIHQVGEDWVRHGTVPRPEGFAPSRRGYLRAMTSFLVTHGDGLEVAEQITGSKVHGFAGTCDTVACTTLNGARVRVDYKTSKQCYARTHFRQLGAYELAAVENGDEPCDRLAIVILRPDGEWTIHYADEVVWRDSPQESFLRVLDVFRDEAALRAHEDAEYKARRAREGAAK